MPNRIIKESIRTSKSVNQMTDFQFRLWSYLITFVDDYGRGSADPEIIKGFVFPRRKSVTESTIEKTLAELATIGSILLYEVDGESYLCFPNWSEHQSVRNKVSKFPAPEDGKIIIASNCNQLQANASKCPRNPIQSNPESNILSNESITRTRAKASKSAYGKYKNVMLSDDEYRKLKDEHENHADAIEYLSEYMERKEYKAKSHYLTLEKWVFTALDERKQDKNGKVVSSFNTDALFEAALNRSYGD